MTPYTDEEIDSAIDRIARDVEGRTHAPYFHGPHVAPVIDRLRRMESARRTGDRAAALLEARDIEAGLAEYRPTNATARSKAIVLEVTRALLGDEESPV